MVTIEELNERIATLTSIAYWNNNGNLERVEVTNPKLEASLDAMVEDIAKMEKAKKQVEKIEKLMNKIYN